MKTTLFAVLVFAFAVTSFAADGKPVSYKSGDDTVNGILYMPQGKGPFPALVVIHEYWGLNDWVKEQASKLADQGYAALAIDLYRGQVGTTPDEAHQLMRGVPEDRANRDLLAATAFLATQKNVDAKRIGSIGWCMGGGYSLDLAIADPKLKAAVINYGHLASDDATLKKINAPILGLFGGQDKGIPPADVKKFESQLKALGKTADIHIFPDAGHAFENPNNKTGYRADDAAEAWKLTVAFLAKYLK
ncbi:MAG TPA: dienelactone hydrolase family protein [Candidatus Angelobacter sp.]|jgi:carboxymethylenebutenolidase|nr:dienelactone hydrolase family protein [Candidatus Angelobacter sp.]